MKRNGDVYEANEFKAAICPSYPSVKRPPRVIQEWDRVACLSKNCSIFLCLHSNRLRFGSMIPWLDPSFPSGIAVRDRRLTAVATFDASTWKSHELVVGYR
ncbi:hypothetical protein HZU73_06530 [Apis mellifera caucasica]|nr:hypothetical protein HZU73_06530 [Apis mellifera caucasica]